MLILVSRIKISKDVSLFVYAESFIALVRFRVTSFSLDIGGEIFQRIFLHPVFSFCVQICKAIKINLEWTVSGFEQRVFIYMRNKAHVYVQVKDLFLYLLHKVLLTKKIITVKKISKRKKSSRQSWLLRTLQL